MSDLRANSILGAVIGSVLGVMGIGVLADSVYHPNYPEKAGFLPVIEETTSGGAAAGPAGPPDFGTLFADPAQLAELVARGERDIAACRSCHTFEAGGADGTGPNLHDVFGRQVAAHAAFNYSDGMRAHGGSWDYLALNDFLLSPARATPGTRMAFAGIRRDESRVAVIAYLRSISPNQVPLPAPLPVAAPADAAAAPADGAAAPAAAPAPVAGGH